MAEHGISSEKHVLVFFRATFLGLLARMRSLETTEQVSRANSVRSSIVPFSVAAQPTIEATG